MEIRNCIHNAARFGFATLALAVLAIASASRASAQDYVHSGKIEQQGKFWSEQVECAAPVKDGARLILRTDAGSVQVEPGASGRIRCAVALRAYQEDKAQARRLFAAYKVKMQKLPDGGVFINATFPASLRKSFSVKYHVTAPTRLNFDLETKSGSIAVAGPVQGAVRATTAAGDVKIGDATGKVNIETAGGNIALGNAGSAVEARTAGGGIHVGNVTGDATLESNGGDIVAREISGAAKIETAGGDIELEGAHGAIQAVTSGGQIQIGKAGGSVLAESAGGSVRIGRALGLVRVQTAGGSIDLYQLQGPVQAETRRGSIVAQIAANGKAFSASTLQTSTGDIQVYVPQNLPLTIDAAIQDASGHRIISDFPFRTQAGNRIILQGTVRGRAVLNGGGGVLKIRCVGGNIEIRKLDARTIEYLKAQKAVYWAQPANSRP